MSLGSLFLSELDAGPPSRAQAPLRTCTRHRAPSFDSCTPSSCSTTCLDNPTEPSDLSSTTKITTLNHLRSLVPHSYCIGIDVEGIEGIAQGITSVGISILPPVFSLSPASADGSWPWPFPDHHQGQIDLDTIASHYRLQSYCFAVLGRERARSYEHFHYGEVVHHPITHLQSTIVSVLQSIRLQDPTAHTILVGFDMELEHRAVKSVFPLLDDHVTHWCDVSHTGLADARWEGRRVAHKTHRKISLRDAMLALNFRRNHGIQPRARHHSAGMDAVRTLGTMLALLARAPEAGGLVVKRFTWEEHGNRKLWEWVPRPASKFPWTVKIVPVPTDDKDGTAHLPESLGRPARLFNFVTRNFAEPKAVAVCPPARSGPLKTHGWESTYKRPGVTPTPTPPAAASPFGPPSASPVPGAHPLAAAPANPSMSYLQHQAVPAINLSDPRVANALMAQYSQQSQPQHQGGRGGFGAGGRGGSQQQQRPRPQPVDKPKAKIAILGCEPWFLVYTKYGRRFAFNPVKNASYWRIPEKILPAVIELDKERIRRKAAGEPPLEEDPRYKSHDKEEEKAEGKNLGSGQQGLEETHDYDSSEYEEVEVTDDEGADHNDAEHPSQHQRTEDENQGPIEFTEDDFAAQLAMMEGDGMDIDQEYDFAAQAENVEPLSDADARLLFRDLLADFRINPYSPFQKLIDEGDKTGVFSDPRYTALSSMRERREVYDEWSREAIQALKEARAKEEKKDPRIPYLAFLQEHATPKLYWAEFKRKYRKEDVMKDSAHHRSFNDKEREKLYREHINRLKLPHTQLKSDLKKLLESVQLRQLNNRSSAASLPSQILADIRYISLDAKTRDEFIEGYIQGLASPPEAQSAAEEAEDEVLRKAREERKKREKALEERERRVEEEKRRQEKRLAVERARLREEERELQRAMVVDKKGLQSQLGGGAAAGGEASKEDEAKEER
ncbi:hypothetical protein GE21DRAFT_1252643 [Neurospora crassa]|nr:hypothetical protein GE21DRAFT_1252643 [Neurospora crassa]